jgi:phenylacetate-CoA ligase
MDEQLTDSQRFPLLTDASQRMLRRLQEHPHGPRYTYRCGERLTETGLANVRAYAKSLQTERTGWHFGEVPPWLREWMELCRREVPFHRRRLDWTDDFFSLPPIDRGEVRREPWAFVPDSADLTDLVIYPTSGTTGNVLIYPAHPEVPNRYLPLYQLALRSYGVELEGGERVSIIQVSAQKSTYTLPSVISYLGGAGFAKINLNPDDWRSPEDRVHFLDDCAPEIYTGDPIAFTELARLPLRARPRALLSLATALLPGLQRELESHFKCPVIDVYSLSESGPVAFAFGAGHEVLPHHLYVEILDPSGSPCPPGTRGEITLTGGINPLLPLLRYRTHDYAALDYSENMPVLIGLEGRPPTVFRNAKGRIFNSIDVSTVLRDLPTPLFSLHQAGDGSLQLRCVGDERTRKAAETALRDLFGADVPLTVEILPDATAWKGKAIQYTSEWKTG